jgi:hypothetical protein
MWLFPCRAVDTKYSDALPKSTSHFTKHRW